MFQWILIRINVCPVLSYAEKTPGFANALLPLFFSCITLELVLFVVIELQV